MSEVFSNNLQRTVSRFDVLPEGLRKAVTSTVLGRIVRFVGTAGIQFERVSPERVVLTLSNRRAVQNHIKGVHAAAMALLAETATGFAVGMNLPDDKLPLLKSMKVDFMVRAQGGLRAEASLKPEQIALLRSEPKGEVLVPVMIADQSGGEPINCEMVWAWVPKKK